MIELILLGAGRENNDDFERKVYAITVNLTLSTEARKGVPVDLTFAFKCLKCVKVKEVELQVLDHIDN